MRLFDVLCDRNSAAIVSGVLDHRSPGGEGEARVGCSTRFFLASPENNGEECLGSASFLRSETLGYPGMGNADRRVCSWADSGYLPEGG